VLSPSSPPSASAPLVEQRRLIQVFLAAIFTYVFLANAWLGDDAYITFRVVWNFVHGYGPVFNPGERVQAYTHPLWMLVMSAAHFVTRDFFFTAQVVSYGFVLAALLRIARRTESAAAAAVVFVWVLSSKAFMDYASSGLEYPLSYCLLAFFYTRWFAVADRPLETRDLRRFGFVAGLAFVNRIDSVLLYALPLAWLALRTLRADRARLAALVTGFAVPAGAWLLFATIYYGFPLPNTYYAKVATGIPSSLLYQQGLAYLFNSLAHDPVTLTSIGFAAALAARADGAARAAAGSALLYVVYTVSVGGDFMSGRFFAMPFLVSVMVAVRLLAGVAYQPVALGTLLLYNLLTPLAPVKVGPGYDAGWPWRTQNGVRDEHGHSHQGSNPLTSAPFRQLPDHTWVREGLSFRNGPEKVTVQGSIGAYGLFAGPDRHLVDRNALSDPLLARLPVSPRLYFEFYSGHFFRDIPDGYLQSIETGRNQLTDPLLHGYYDRLRRVLHDPLFSSARLSAIWYLNAGPGRHLADEYEQRRAIALSIRASNERFLVDAGEKDDAAGTIKSVGRPGYLEFGPAIPIKRGVYRVRWVGTVTGASDAPFGFVDVWDGGTRIARQEVTGGSVRPDTRQIAELTFTLPKGSSSLDYRLWVDGRASVTLERMEIETVK
jgi:arabinofuranosyltransferase